MGSPSLGVLLLHGFSSNPENFRYTVALLEAHNLEYQVPLLSGHGAHSPKALSGVTRQMWLKDCEQALHELSTRVDKVIILGHSMGGWLALNLSIEFRAIIDSIIIAGSSMRTVSFFGPGRPMHFLVPMMARLYKHWDFTAVYTDQSMVHSDSGYDWLPTDAFIQLFDLLKMTQQRLAEVDVPILILHSRNDSTNDPRGVKPMYQSIATPAKDKQVIWFEKTEHSMFLDCERDVVNATILDFLKERIGSVKA